MTESINNPSVGGEASAIPVVIVGASGASQELDCGGGSVIYEITEDAPCTYSLTGAVAGVECIVTLIRHAGGDTPVLPDAEWANDLPIPPTATDGKTDVFVFVCYDGAMWFASAYVTNVTTSTPPPPSEIVSDTFTRADGAIGNTETAQAWVEWASTWLIDTNKVKCSAVTAGENGFALVNAGVPNAEVRVDITMEALSYMGLAARFTDEDNFILLQPVAGDMRLYKLVAGVATELDAASAPTSPDGETHTWAIRCDGDLIETYKDGVLAHSVTDAFNNTVENFGMRVYNAANTTGRFDNFEVVAV